MFVIYNEYYIGIYNWIKQKNIFKVLFFVKFILFKDILRKDIVWFYIVRF